MRKIVFVSFVVIFCVKASAQDLSVTRLECASKIDPIAVDEEHPALSWQVQSRLRNVSQTAYRILVADDSASLAANRGNVWDSRRVLSDQSIQVSYDGAILQPGKLYFWKVKVWDNKQHVSRWSSLASWRMGLLSAADWRGASWISYQLLPDSLRTVPFVPGDGGEKWTGVRDTLPMLRKRFILDKRVKAATAYVCGLGQFELSVNGRKVGDHFLDPGWTQYDKRALYVAFDLTDYLSRGANAIGVMLGNGFYFIPGDRYRKMSGAYGNPKLICRVAIQFMDGTSEDIISDTNWKSAPGPVIWSSIYGGEDYDARLQQTGWDRPAFDDRAWKAAVRTTGPPELDAQMTEPLKIVQDFVPRRIFEAKPGQWVYDLGQNASGIPRLEVLGQRGSTVRITPSELLGDDSLASQQAIGEPVYFSYTLDGTGKETWQPKFMYYGFRYLQVKGAVPAGEPNPNHLPVILGLHGMHTRNAAVPTGHFSCSNPLFNQTFALIDWAIQSNTASIFTDCPHREKLGWLEEAHLVGPSIRYNYNIATLLRKVVRDMRVSQTPDGLIPDIAPEYTVFDGGFRDSPEWGSSGIMLPWYAWQWYGDRQILEESYPMMTRYADYLEKKSCDHLLTFGLGDWYDIGPKMPGESQLTPPGLTATAIYYYDLCIVTHTASMLGKVGDSVRYSRLAAEVRAAFNRNFFHAATRQYGTGSQTANAMALYMGLVGEGDTAAVLDHLIRDIRDHHNGLTAGDIGFRYLLRVLDDAGRSDVIFDMNSRTDVPGYGYQLIHGATALTESWQAYRNASNNHFMLGHLMEWFYSGLAGIRPAAGAIAFKDIVIRPEPVGDVMDVSASYLSPYGTISSQWVRHADSLTLTVSIPANTHATIWLPDGPSEQVWESGLPVASRRDVEFIGRREHRAVYKVGSGVYVFSCKTGVIAQNQWKVVRSGLIVAKPAFQQCHASTIVDISPGKLMAAWFGGSHEGANDVVIWTSTSVNGQWDVPVVRATGVMNDSLRYPCWNPVLFKNSVGKLFLFYKVGPSVRLWWGMVITSMDQGRTWSSPVRLPQGILGPIKNKPVQFSSGTILSPSSVETSAGWTVHLERSEDNGNSWSSIPLDSGGFDVIQPSILTYGDGRLQILCRSKQDAVIQSWSVDSGRSWSPLSWTTLPNPNSGIDAVTLHDGRQVIVYNPDLPGKEWSAGRGRLRVAVSEDGYHWTDILALENGTTEEYSYPAIIQAADGLLYITYTYNRKNIRYVAVRPASLSNKQR